MLLALLLSCVQTYYCRLEVSRSPNCSRSYTLLAVSVRRTTETSSCMDTRHNVKALTPAWYPRALLRWTGRCPGSVRPCHAGSRPRCAAHCPRWAWRCADCESPPADASGPDWLALCWPPCPSQNPCWTCEDETQMMLCPHFLSGNRIWRGYIYSNQRQSVIKDCRRFPVRDSKLCDGMSLSQLPSNSTFYLMGFIEKKSHIIVETSCFVCHLHTRQHHHNLRAIICHNN